MLTSFEDKSISRIVVSIEKKDEECSLYTHWPSRLKLGREAHRPTLLHKWNFPRRAAVKISTGL
jgi:hypothetical protein